MSWIDYDQHARRRPRDDLWGQVRRTVRGVPVSAEQIDLIVAAIVAQLGLDEHDVLLDLACGNGALTDRLHPLCRASLGVDISPYLIEIAKENFAAETHEFRMADAAEFVETEPHPSRFTKALCYGSLSYLSDADTARMLTALRLRFNNVSRVMLGNLPDPRRAAAFTAASLDMHEPRSDIGVWRSPEALAALAGPSWQVQTSIMPSAFFAAHYRFDAMLVRLS